MQITDGMKKLAEAWESPESIDDESLIGAMHDACCEGGFSLVAAKHFIERSACRPGGLIVAAEHFIERLACRPGGLTWCAVVGNIIGGDLETLIIMEMTEMDNVKLKRKNRND